MLLPALPPFGPATGEFTGDLPPAQGDWVVRNDTSATGENIVLNGNLTVTNGSRLELTDSVIRINATFHGEFAIIVESGSTLMAENVTFTRAGDYAYSFVFAAGSNGSLTESVVAYAGASGGLALHTANVTLANTTLRDSPMGVRLFAAATVTGNTFLDTPVGTTLSDTLAANNVAADNTFTNCTIARVRHLLNTMTTVVDQEGEAVEGARVWLNDTLHRNWLDTITDAAGESGPHALADWEVASDGTNRSLEPYNLTAMKHGRRNLTTATPSTDPTPTIELVLRPDLVVRGEEITIQIASTEGGLLLPRHSNWSWLETDDPPTGWEEPNFDDSGWSVAQASFGAGDNFEDENTDWGSNSWSGNDEAIFRTHFDLPEPAGGAVLKLAVADGAIAYLNGVRVVNDLQGNQNDNSREASLWDYLTGEKPSGLAALDPSLLRVGDNVLAIQVFDTGRRNFFDAEFEVSYLEEVAFGVVNQSLFVTAKLHNQGTKIAEDALVRLLDNGIEVTNLTVDIGVGANHTLNFPWAAFPAGNHTLEVVAEYTLAEENESNNNGSVQFFVGDFGVNLTGDNYTAIPFTENCRFNFTVENVGDLDDNVTLAVGSLPSGWLGQVEPSLISLGPGHKDNVTLTVQPTRSASQGNYTFTLTATSSFQQGTTTATIVPAGRDEATEWLWMTHELDDDDPENWAQLDFDDSSWSWDPAPFGDSSSEDGVDYNTEWDGNEFALFRHYFTLPSGAELISALLSTGSNDNGAHYVNGVEVYSDLGGGAHWGKYWNEETAFDASILKPGQVNLLAGKVRNDDRANWFDTQLEVEFRVGSSIRELTVEILPTHDFELDRAADVLDQRFNTTVQYPVNITNFGNLNETVELNLTAVQQDGPWSASLSHDNVTLTPGEQVEIYIEVVGGFFDGSEALDLRLTARSRDFPALVRSYTLNLTAYPPTYGFDAYCDEPYRIIDPGANHTFVIAVENLGNIDDTFDVVIASNETTNFTLGNYTAALALPYETGGEVLVNLIVNDTAHRKAFCGLNMTLTSRGAGTQRWVTLDARPYYPRDVTPPTSTMDIDAPNRYGTYYVNESWFMLGWRLTDDSDDLLDYAIEYSVNTGSGFGAWTHWANFTNTSARFHGTDGWLYRFRSLAHDEYDNVEDKGDYDLEIRVDLVAPTSRLWIEEEVGEATNLDAVTLRWESEVAESVTFTVATRYLVGTAHSQWITLVDDTLTEFYTFNAPTDNTYEFRVLAHDWAGNVELQPGADAAVTFDRATPEVTLSGLPPLWGAKSLTLTLGEPSEPLSAVSLQWASLSEALLLALDEGGQTDLTWSNFSVTWDNGSAEFPGLQDGFVYYFRLLPSDAADNRAERTKVEVTLVSNGSTNQSFALPIPLLPFAVGGGVTVAVDENRDGTFERELEAATNPAMMLASQYWIDYGTGHLLFGDNDTGYLPGDDVPLRVTYAGYDGHVVVDTRPPGVATELEHTMVDNNTVRLLWKETANAVAYRIERTTNISQAWTEIATITPVGDGYSSYTDTELQYIAYHYRVVAVDRMGYSSESTPMEVDLTPIADETTVETTTEDGWLPWLLALGISVIGLAAAGIYMRRTRAAAPRRPTLEALDGTELEPVSAPERPAVEAPPDAASDAGSDTESPFRAHEDNEFAPEPRLVCSGCGEAFAVPDGELAFCPGCGVAGPKP